MQNDYQFDFDLVFIFFIEIISAFYEKFKSSRSEVIIEYVDFVAVSMWDVTGSSM